jgi:hypothetical protein
MSNRNNDGGTMKLKYAMVAGLLVLGACDSGSAGPGGGGNVAIRFGTGSGAAANLQTEVKTSGITSAATDLTVTGTNGTLVIQDIRLIASRFKLKGTEATCPDSISNSSNKSQGDGDREHDGECDEFQGGPFIVDLPLDGTNTTIATDKVPAGTYNWFSFKVKSLEVDDDEDSSEKANVPALVTQMRTFYPNFPGNASMVVKGTFNGTPFTTYFRANMLVVQKLDPPLVVPGDNSVNVTIDPSLWFKTGSQVLNLAALNGQTVQMGSGFINGVRGANRHRD